MATLSVAGHASALALVTEQYATIVDLREALTAEQQAHEETRAQLDALRCAVLEEAGLPEPGDDAVLPVKAEPPGP